MSERTGAMLKEVRLEGLRLHAISEKESIQYVVDSIRAGRGGWIVTPNLDHFKRLCRDNALRLSYEHADLALADGMPLVWASALQRTPLAGRVAGADLILSLSRAAAKHNLTVFLLGGDPGTAERAAAELQRRYPSLLIAGTMSPQVNCEPQEREVGEVAGRLLTLKPDIIFVALGSPKQERLIERIRPALPTSWWMGVGVSFSFIAGTLKRAPRWIQRIGLEWVYRLLQEPRRLARRYLVDCVPYGTGLLMRAAIRGLRAGLRNGLGRST